MLISDLFPGDRLAAMRDYMKKFSGAFGVADMGEPTRLPNTRKALAAAEYARDQGRLDAFRTAAMEAHWKDDRDLEDEGVIREVARTAGVDPEGAVRAMTDRVYLDRIDSVRREAEDNLVTGIPTFFFGDLIVVGCQPYEKLARAATKAGARPR